MGLVVRPRVYGFPIRRNECFNGQLEPYQDVDGKQNMSSIPTLGRDNQNKEGFGMCLLIGATND